MAIAKNYVVVESEEFECGVIRQYGPYTLEYATAKARMLRWYSDVFVIVKRVEDEE